MMKNLFDCIHFEYLSWSTIKPVKTLLDNEIHLWRIHELPKDGVDSLKACAQIISFYCGDNVEIIRNANGKPVVYSKKNYTQPYEVQFNLSHSRNSFLIGFIKNSYIGVDIESPHSQRDFLSLATRFFSENEISQLKLCPLEKQKDLFYQFWTLKEAMIKCLGTSLFVGLQRAQFIISDSKINLDTDFKKFPEDQFFQFKHFKDTDYFSIVLTSFAN